MAPASASFPGCLLFFFSFLFLLLPLAACERSLWVGFFGLLFDVYVPTIAFKFYEAILDYYLCTILPQSVFPSASDDVRCKLVARCTQDIC
jgi:hypothetical protein